MEFQYNGKTYEIGKVVEPETNYHFGICVVFELTHDKEEEDIINNELVTWFYVDRNDIVEQAKERLDWLENQKS